jgi:hypothetical protein
VAAPFNDNVVLAAPLNVTPITCLPWSDVVVAAAVYVAAAAPPKLTGRKEIILEELKMQGFMYKEPTDT